MNDNATLRHFEKTFFKGRKIKKVKILAATPNPKIDINFERISLFSDRQRVPIERTRADWQIGEVVLDNFNLDTNRLLGTATLDFNSNDSILYLLLLLYEDNSRDVFQVDLEILSTLFINYLEI